MLKSEYHPISGRLAAQKMADSWDIYELLQDLVYTHPCLL